MSARSLSDYGRLSLAGYRVIYRERTVRGSRVIDCVFAERRALVYGIFTRLLVEKAME